MASSDASAMNDVGLKWLNEFKFADAIRLFERAKKTLDELVGERNPFTTDVSIHHALALSYVGEHEEAKRVATSVVEIRRQMFGEESVYFANVVEVLGEIYARAGLLKEAEAQLRLADQSYVKLFDDEFVDGRLTAVANLVEVLNESGQFSEAEPLAHTAVAIAGRRKDKTLVYLRARLGLAQCLHGLGKAESAADEFADIMVIVADWKLPLAQTVDLISRYVVVLESLGHTKEADSYKDQLRDLKELIARTKRASDEELSVPPE
jgi:tetratricopeptide (TPR) repeat protein